MYVRTYERLKDLEKVTDYKKICLPGRNIEYILRKFLFELFVYS